MPTKDQPKGNLKCNFCGRNNHLEKDCFFKKKALPQANFVEDAEANGSGEAEEANLILDQEWAF